MTEGIAVEVTLYDELIIYSHGGEVTYKGKPDGFPVSKACVTEGGGVLALSKTEERDYVARQNLLMLDRLGRVVWRADLPQPSSGDAYVSFTYDSGMIWANSWSGYRVKISPSNGRILSTEFTK